MIKLTGLAEQLRREIDKIPVIDCHEHLPTEAQRLEKTIDVMTLFSHYCVGDIEAAGLLQGDPQNEVFDASKPLMPRWRKFKPYFEAIRHGSYAYPALTYVREVLGIDGIGDDTVEEITARLQADNKPGVYKKLIQDLCGIEKSIQCTGVVEGDQPFFVHLCHTRTRGVCNNEAIDGLAKDTGVQIGSLADCVEALNVYVKREKDKGAVGLKMADAYSRTIEYPDTPTEDAERIFAKLRRPDKGELTGEENRALENYLTRRQVAACIESDLVVVIHTGYQAGNRGDIRAARATGLWSLLKDFPKARFDLFHGSFPYVSDMTVLGKYFENVTLNMCWMHIMGPAVSRRALDEWLDAVPVTKIFAFGGDYSVPEKIYGHLQLARADVATVLAEKVQAGRMTETDALEVARLIFHENPKRWYGLRP